MTDSGSSLESQTVDPKIFLGLSKRITEKDLIALSDHLDITQETLSSIQTDNKGNHDAVVHTLLRKWWQMNGKKATNGVLWEALDSAGLGQVADDLREGKYSQEVVDLKRSGHMTKVSSQAVQSKLKGDHPTAATKPTTTTTSADVPYYKMKSKPLGKCLILTYSFKDDRGLKRRGNNIDIRNLKEVFGKKFLGFEVEHHPDLNYKDTIEVIKDMSEKHHSDCFVLFVCSHGDAESFITMGQDEDEDEDKKTISIQEVLTIFDVKNCESLAGKPKIFFFNTCRGDALQQMAEYKMKKDGGPATAGIGATISYYRPNEADFCVVLSTIPGFASLRDAEKGSFFVENLCKCLKDNYTKLHLIDLLTVNNENMIKEAETDERFTAGESKICQVTTTITSLSKAVYFVDKDK